MVAYPVRLTPMESNSQLAEEEAIKLAIKEECEAFYLRDFDRWAEFWVHDESVQRLVTDAGGNISAHNGWDEGGKMIKRMMTEHPKPNHEAVAKVRREFTMMHINGSMAWASFNQITPRTDDILVNAGLSFQSRVLEKHNGFWKVRFAAHADTRMEYFHCPAICVESDGTISWSNDEAKAALTEHPVLAAKAGRLFARRSEDNARLLAAVERMDALTPMDFRLSPFDGTRAQAAIALVLDDPFDDAAHVVWVDRVDGTTTITFGDTATAEQRLEAAAAIFGLSKSQHRLGQLIVSGMDMPEAAKEMDVSINTVRTHLQRMFEKARVNSQTALVRVLLSAEAPNV